MLLDDILNIVVDNIPIKKLETTVGITIYGFLTMFPNCIFAVPIP